MSWFTRWNDRPINKKEIEKIKVIQKHYDAFVDGSFGEQLLDSIYRSIAPVYPYSALFFDANVLISDKIQLVHSLNKATCGTYNNSLSGTFQWQNTTSSMLCIDGKWKRKSSTHDWLKQPETVIYVNDKGEIKAKRCLYSSEIEEDVVNAIGGVGLHNYDPKAEGFTGAYADVLRKTYHTALGHDGKSWLGVYAYGTGEQIRSLMIDKLKCKVAIMLDGGSIAAINTDTKKSNVKQLQNNIIQFI